MTRADQPAVQDTAENFTGENDPEERECGFRARRVASWAAGFLIVFTLLAAWSLATPRYAAPDEPAHAYRAASLVRGQLLGKPVNVPGDPRVVVQVPTTLTAVGPGCFAFQS